MFSLGKHNEIVGKKKRFRYVKKVKFQHFPLPTLNANTCSNNNDNDNDNDNVIIITINKSCKYVINFSYVTTFQRKMQRDDFFLLILQRKVQRDDFFC